jgi:hypothetical protein
MDALDFRRRGQRWSEDAARLSRDIAERDREIEQLTKRLLIARRILGRVRLTAEPEQRHVDRVTTSHP